MRMHNLPKLPLAIASALLLAACTETAPKKEEAPPPKPEPVMVEPQPEPLADLSPSGHIREAMSLIQKGEPDEARRHLDAALVKKPRNKVAKKLLMQLEADPKEMLGAKSFPYKLQRDESLSLVAKKFMGDPLMFVILARYNNIEKPGRVSVGQTLQIPEKYRSARLAPKPEPTELDADEKAALEEAEAMPAAGDEPPEPTPEPAPEPEPVVEPEPEPEPEVDTASVAYDEAKVLYDQGDYKSAVIKLEMASIANPADKDRFSGLLVSSYTAYAGQLIRSNELYKARDILNRASETDPANEKVIDELALVEDKIEAEKAYKAGQAQRKSNQLEKAYKSFKSAVTYDDQPPYRKALDETREILAEQYHRKAMEHYRKEELVEAKRYWRKVLEVDPDNSLAPGYLSKVEEIQKRLRRLGD